MIAPAKGADGRRSGAAQNPDRPARTWRVADFRPAGPHHTVENLPAHVVSGSIALILIVLPVLFHRAFAGLGAINILIVLAGIGVAILTLLLSIKDYHPAPRRRPSYPPGISSQEKTEIAQLGAAYGRFRDALDSVPEGQPKNRIAFALAGTEPGDIPPPPPPMYSHNLPIHLWTASLNGGSFWVGYRWALWRLPTSET